jgi:hypothetical protein
VAFNLTPGSGPTGAAARRALRAIPRQERSAALRLARDGSQHPDPHVASVMRDWAVSVSERPWQVPSIAINLGVAVWAFARVPHTRWPALSLGIGMLSLLVAGISATTWFYARRLRALPDVLPAARASTPKAAVRTTPAQDGELRERGQFLSPDDKAHLATMPPEPPVAGWYADPLGGEGTRYWNGINWTGRTIST